MVTLHGFTSSNYYNIVKYVLLYKDISFAENITYGGGDEWLSISPVGKIPAITTDEGVQLSETTVICEYLEETYPDKPLFPDDRVSRARVRQIMKVAELYLELSSRSLIAYAFSGKEAPEVVAGRAREVTVRGIGAMNRLCQFSPWIAGSDFSMADIFVHYANAVVRHVGPRQLDWDIVAEIKGMDTWTRRMEAEDFAQRIEADRRASEPQFAEYIAKNVIGKA